MSTAKAKFYQENGILDSPANVDTQDYSSGKRVKGNIALVNSPFVSYEIVSGDGRSRIVKNQTLKSLIQSVYGEGFNSKKLNHWLNHENSTSSKFSPGRHTKPGGPNRNDIEPTDDVMDLHGFPCPVAIAAVDFVFQEIVSNAKAKTFSGMSDEEVPLDMYNRNLKIVTGRGNHINNSGERGTLKSTIERHIVENFFPTGMLQVNRLEGNEGCILILRKDINIWLSAVLRDI